MSLVKSGSSTQDSMDSMGRWGVPFSATGAKRTVLVETKVGRMGGQQAPSHIPHTCSPARFISVSRILGFRMEFSQQRGASFYGNRGTENSAFSITARLHGNLGTAATLTVWSTETEKATGSMDGRKGPPGASLGSWVNQGLNQLSGSVLRWQC